MVSEIATIEVFCTPVGKRQSFSPPSSSSQITNVEPFSELASGFMQSLIFELPTDKRVDSRKEEQLKVQILRGEEKKKEKKHKAILNLCTKHSAVDKIQDICPAIHEEKPTYLPKFCKKKASEVDINHTGLMGYLIIISNFHQQPPSSNSSLPLVPTLFVPFHPHDNESNCKFLKAQKHKKKTSTKTLATHHRRIITTLPSLLSAPPILL